jgi:proteic killer suppression protein
MIKSIRHKGLRLLWTEGDASKLPAGQVRKIEQRLAAIDSATLVPHDFGAFPGWKPHKLTGDRKDFWSVWVSGNDRIIFRWDGQHAYDLDYLDYH